ncbi:hypothetical protein LA080_011669 [Diaporthe eres]|nr:hypothetical protein LA080_011669 [Diaporthe eres]
MKTSLLALSDIQIFTGLAILISGFVSLCPSPTQPNGFPAYHWQILVHLAWFSTITHQGTLFLMRKYFREHRWQRNVRLLLMCALLVLLMIAMVPTASFNWYSKRSLVQLEGPSDSRGLVPDNWLVHYSTLAKSAAQPVSPALCYFDISTANDLYSEADPCPWGDFTPVRPPRLTAAATWIIRRFIRDEKASLFASFREETGLDLVSTLEQYCDLHTPLFGTVSFQAAVLGMASMAILSSWNAVRLFGFPSSFFRRHIRNPISRYSRRGIGKESGRAMHWFPATGHKPDLAESLVTTPLLAMHLIGRLMVNLYTAKLTKVLLLIFTFVQGCIRLYPAHDPYFHRVQHEGWTFGQILAALSPLSPLALVVHEVLNGGRRAWHTSSNQPAANPTPATVTTQTDNLSHDSGIGLREMNNGHTEGNVTGPNTGQIRNADDQGEGNIDPDGATSVLDSPEHRSSIWMSIAVWFAVVTVTLLASAELVYIYGGYSDIRRLSILLMLVFGTLPTYCAPWVLVGLSIRSEAAHYASGYHHGSRFITGHRR